MTASTPTDPTDRTPDSPTVTTTSPITCDATGIDESPEPDARATRSRAPHRCITIRRAGRPATGHGCPAHQLIFG